MATKIPYSYAFPVPPVCTTNWTPNSWKRWERRNGRVLRSGDAPTVLFCGKLVPLARDEAGNVLRDAKGKALYDMSRAYESLFVDYGN